MSNISLDRPTDASSSLSGHTANKANDGDANSSWMPNHADPEPWLLIDFESRCKVVQMNVKFSGCVQGRIAVEMQQEDGRWKEVAALNPVASSGVQEMQIVLPAEVSRYLRMNFHHRVSGAEIEVHDLQIYGSPVR